MNTTINTVEDIIRVVDADPDLLEALRARLLTRELLNMPQTLADFIDTTNRRFEEVDRRFEEVDRRFEDVDRRFEDVDRRFDTVDGRLQRLEDRTGLLVGAHARNEGLRELVFLSRDMGMTRMQRLWSSEDIDALIQAGDTTGILSSDLRSFRRADAIVEATDDEGRTCYIAVEISFTVDGRDTNRAIRNAAYITRFTGKAAYPAVMGVHIDRRVRDAVESGDLYWYPLARQLLEVE